MNPETTELALQMLRDLYANEPPQDAGNHPSMELHERVGATWAEWDRKVTGLRLMLGTWLVNAALEDES